MKLFKFKNNMAEFGLSKYGNLIDLKKRFAIFNIKQFCLGDVQSAFEKNNS